MIKALFPGMYLQGSGAIKELPALLRRYGSKALLLGSPRVLSSILPSYEDFLPPGLFTPEKFAGECSEKELLRIQDRISAEQVDLVIGMGGGKTIDTAKIAADRAGLPVVIVPTIASTDAPCSSCAVRYTPSGIFDAVLYQKRSPAVVLVDMDIIANAPSRFLVAGMGDALATWFEARSCNTTKSLNECGGHSTLAGIGIARLCYDTLLEYGVPALIANEEHVISPALNNITEANILLSGIGFESCGIACAHAVHNGFTVLPETHTFYHGEKVAFGVLTGLNLTGARQHEVEEVYGFCESIGLPTTLHDIGITDPSPTKLMKVAEEACKEGSSIYKEAGDINAKMLYEAIIMADAFGRKRIGKHKERNF